MFFDLSREKLLVLALIIVLLAGGIVLFIAVNGAWALVAQSEQKIALAESDFRYWLLYELPDEGQAAAIQVPAGDARSIPVLLYHGEGGSMANMPLSLFVDQLRTLKENGWHTITMEQFDEWEKGKIQLPDKSFLLTFDDGRKDSYYEADPVLQSLGFNAVMFVITGFSMPADGKSSNFYLNETELADMVASGRWELESHGDEDHSLYAVQSTTDLNATASTTSGHFLSNKFWNTQTNSFETDAQFTARVENDMQQSVQTLDNDFGIKVIAFAYPFNDFGQDTVNFPGSQAILDKLMPQIYSYTFYQTWPGNGDTFNYPETNNGPGATAYMEKRIEPGLTWTGQDLLNVLDAGAAKSLPYQTETFGMDWVQAWGNVTPASGSLSLSANASTTGADAFLNGSGWWTNYYFSAVANWQTNTDVSLIARNDADVSYVACAFSPSHVEIERHFAGQQSEASSADYQFTGSPSAAHLGIGVYGNTVTCYENGVAVISATVPLMPVKGGIGVEIWNKNTGVARSLITSVSVSQNPPAQPKAASTAAAALPSTLAQPSVPPPSVTVQQIQPPSQSEPSQPVNTSPPAPAATSSQSDFLSRLRDSLPNAHPKRR